MAQTPCVQWGTITLILDNEAFRKGFLSARQWYFQDIYGKEGSKSGTKPTIPHAYANACSRKALVARNDA
ncbi:MAG TPA: hypothetical protein VKV37_09945 [Ktedonobacteraceae bacterium]|jgi:hypothetical protein|nr:hypothetical protein [Ktedonobacteraceae bacterium]HLI89001.1 hypothetical protein [Ktedonobacteraceae bacterium]